MSDAGYAWALLLLAWVVALWLPAFIYENWRDRDWIKRLHNIERGRAAQTKEQLQ